MTIVNFTPLTGFAGGLLIGIAASVLLWFNGRIAGISGIVDGAMAKPGSETIWRWLFLLGMLGGASIEFWLIPARRAFETGLSWPIFLLAGVLVGIGTRLGGGCTSGHGVCGLGRLSGRSLVATASFLTTGVLTVFIVRHVFGIHS
ncbi:putative membrane protein YedE/YeeE [Rhodanobacter sp. TND4EL1]